MSQIITVTFAEGQREAIAAQPLEQWAYGQKLRFEGLDLPEVYQVDFSNFEFCGASIPRVGGADGVAVPVEVLTSGRNVYAFIWIQDETSGARYYRATVRVVPGPEPDTDESPEEQSAVTEAINALNDAAEAIPEQVNAALEEAKASGEFDGPAGSDGVSPTVQITTIEGGHRVTITDAAHPAGQSFDVMDGQGGGSSELHIVDYDHSASTRPDVDEIAAAFDAGKAVLACATDLAGGGHVLPLTSLERSGGAVTGLSFSAGGWTLSASTILSRFIWSLIEAPAEQLVLNFAASWNDTAEAYAVTTAATLAQVDAALAAGQRIEARLMIDNAQLLRQGTVYAERSGSRLVSVTIGYFGSGAAWQLMGTGGGWQLDRTSVELDTTLSKPGEAADAAAVGAALAAKGSYSMPSGGIPKTDLASAVQTSLGKADTAYQKPSGGIPAFDLAAGVIPDLSGYATEQWVKNQGYLKQHQSLANYQTKAITDAGGYYTDDTVDGALQEIGAELANIAGKADKTPRIAMTGADTAPTLDPNKLYVFPEMASLSPTFTAPSDNTIVNEYHFIFESGATATTTTFPAIPGLDNFAAEANMAYEVSILEGRALVISWEVSA